MQRTRPLVTHRRSILYLAMSLLVDEPGAFVTAFGGRPAGAGAVADFCADPATWGAASAEVVADSAPTPTNATAVRVAQTLRRMPMFPLSFPQKSASTRQTSPHGVWLVTNQNFFPHRRPRIMYHTDVVAVARCEPPCPVRALRVSRQPLTPQELLADQCLQPAQHLGSPERLGRRVQVGT